MESLLHGPRFVGLARVLLASFADGLSRPDQIYVMPCPGSALFKVVHIPRTAFVGVSCWMQIVETVRT